MVLRLTSAKHVRAKPQAVKQELRSLSAQGQYLHAVVTGHNRYFGVPCNDSRLRTFRLRVVRLWHRTLCRRSQRHHMPWRRMTGLIERWLLYPKICHPYPHQRLIVTTQGRSRMRNVVDHILCGKSARPVR